MKKYDGLLGAVSILLVVAMIISLGSSLAGAERKQPNNPISSHAETLRAESLKGSGNLAAQDADLLEDQQEEPPEETDMLPL